MDKLKMESKDNVQGNIEKIRELFPNAVTEVLRDGKPTLKVDFDVLKQEMSGTLVDDKEERYQFTWPDKKKSILLANTPINATLRPCKEESVNFDTTENLYIEGDNLDVLKLLQETYLGKIKMIYIDPPYNTGNDFVYNDDFALESEEYLGNSGQYDEQGNRLVQNTESNGRFHTDWLNMIYPRLKVAKDLLSDDGVIFISIDDNEVENLRKVCDEIFGELNFVATFVWKSRQNKDNRNITGVSIDHEYILCYSKNPNTRVVKGDNRKIEFYQNPDNDPRGPWTSANMAGLLPADQRPNCHYDLINPKTGINYGRPTMGWRYDKNTMNKLIEEDRIIWPESANGRPRKKAFLFEISADLPGFSSVVGNDIYTRNATIEVEKLFCKRYFDFPKPLKLISAFIEQTTSKDSIILDFFSGSATTAHAVMQLNAEDGGNRKFIMVQLPEKCDENSEAFKAGYKNICEIGKERIRRAGKKIKVEIEKLNDSPIIITKDKDGKITSEYDFASGIYVEGKDLTVRQDKTVPDIGFRVLKLDSSNMKDVYYKPQDYSQTLLDNLESNIKEDRTPLDLLFQVMLDLGKPLSAKIEEKTIRVHMPIVGGSKYYNAELKTNDRFYKVYYVDGNDLIACFDEGITEFVVKEIAKEKPLYAVFRDSGLSSDSTSANFDQIFATYSPNTTRKVL